MDSQFGQDKAGLKPCIYDFLDFRDYLKEFFNFKKSKEPHYTFTMFSTQVGMKSANHIKLIMDGSRNLTQNYIVSVGKVCELSDREIDYFFNLVAFNQSKNPQQREIFWANLKKTVPKGEKYLLGSTQAKVLSKWYIFPILEMFFLEDFQYDPKWVSKNLATKVSPKEVEEAFDILIEAKLIIKGEDGFDVTNRNIFKDGKVSPQLIQIYHSQLILQSIPALFEVDPELREYSGSTLSVRTEDLAIVKRKIREFQQEILNYCSGVENPNELYQINLQFFPMKRTKDE